MSADLPDKPDQPAAPIAHPEDQPALQDEPDQPPDEDQPAWQDEPDQLPEPPAGETSGHPEDRIGAFAPFILATDALELREIFAGFFERVKEEAWERRTERRPTAWTMRETLAHLDAVGRIYNQAAADAAEGRPVVVPGLSARTDLSEANRAAIQERAETPIAELVASFLDALSQTARLAGRLEPEVLARAVEVPMFGAPATIGELLGGALSHAGVVHGAQISVAARSLPIWAWFRPALLRRQLTRFFHTMGLTYWPERGGDLHATFAFTAIGQGGGSWYVRVSPQGGYGRLGVVRTSELHLTFANPDLLCRMLTLQTSPWRHLLLRRLKIGGRLSLARNFTRLFIPT